MRFSSFQGSNGGLYKTEIPAAGKSGRKLCVERMFSLYEGPIPEASLEIPTFQLLV